MWSAFDIELTSHKWLANSEFKWIIICMRFWCVHEDFTKSGGDDQRKWVLQLSVLYVKRADGGQYGGGPQIYLLSTKKNLVQNLAKLSTALNEQHSSKVERLKSAGQPAAMQSRHSHMHTRDNHRSCLSLCCAVHDIWAAFCFGASECAWSRFKSISDVYLLWWCVPSRHNSRDECILFSERRKSGQHECALGNIGSTFASVCVAVRPCSVLRWSKCFQLHLWSSAVRAFRSRCGSDATAKRDCGNERKRATLSNPKVTIIMCTVCTEYETVVFCFVLLSFFARKLYLEHCALLPVVFQCPTVRWHIWIRAEFFSFPAHVYVAHCAHIHIQPLVFDFNGRCPFFCPLHG